MRLLLLLCLPLRLAAQAPTVPSAEVRAHWAAASAALTVEFTSHSQDTIDAAILTAERHARAAIARDPKLAESHYWLAAVLGRRALRTSFATALRAGTEAYREAHRTLALDSLHAGAHAVIGRFNEELARYPWVVRLAIAGLSGEGDATRASMAIAEREYLAAVRLDPSFVLFRWDYGRFLVGRGRLAEAREQERVARGLPDRFGADAWLRFSLRAQIENATARGR